MRLRIKVFLSSVLAVWFSLYSISAFYSSEPRLDGNAYTFSTSEVRHSNEYGLTADFTISNDSLYEPSCNAALALMRGHASSGTYTITKKSRTQPSVAPFIASINQVSNTFQYLTQQVLSHPRNELCLSASDSSPPLYSLHQT